MSASVHEIKTGHYPLLNKITIIRYDRQNFTIHLLLVSICSSTPERFPLRAYGQNTKETNSPSFYLKLPKPLRQHGIQEH
jgi:hypothetical protein